MIDLHPSALISQKSRIGGDVRIGAYSVVEEEVSIGDHTVIQGHVHIGKGAVIGRQNVIYSGAIIGPRDHSWKPACPVHLKIGDRNVIREFAVISGSSDPSSPTVIGNDNYLMTCACVGPGCRVKDHVTVGKAAMLGECAVLEDGCQVSGGASVRAYCRVGTHAAIGGNATLVKDVPPYMRVADSQTAVSAVNKDGLKRSGISEKAVREIEGAYELFYLSKLSLPRALDAIAKKYRSKEISYFINFLRASKDILRTRARP